MKKRWFERVAAYLERKQEKYPEREYFRIIYDRDTNEPYMKRYYLLNLRPFCRIVLHNVLRGDRDGLHDHPWMIWGTIILSGGYWERTFFGRFFRKPGSIRFRSSKSFHRLELDPDITDVWTLFFMGPKMKDWGFLDKDNQWVQWEEYLSRKKINKR